LIISHSGKIARGVRVPLDQLYNLKTLNVTAQMIDMALSNVLYELIDKSIPAKPLGGLGEARGKLEYAAVCLALPLRPLLARETLTTRRGEVGRKTLGRGSCACPYVCGCIGTHVKIPSIPEGVAVFPQFPPRDAHPPTSEGGKTHKTYFIHIA